MACTFPTTLGTPAIAIRAGNAKLILRFDDNSVELYDLSNDISERKNLTGQKTELAAKLRKQLKAWLKATNAALPKRRAR